MNRWKEVAKFFCGFEVFHAIAATYFWSAGMTLTYLGMTITPTVSAVGAVIHAVIALLLGLYAWGQPATVPSGRATRATAA